MMSIPGLWFLSLGINQLCFSEFSTFFWKYILFILQGVCGNRERVLCKACWMPRDHYQTQCSWIPAGSRWRLNYFRLYLPVDFNSVTWNSWIKLIEYGFLFYFHLWYHELFSPRIPAKIKLIECIWFIHYFYQWKMIWPHSKSYQAFISCTEGGGGRGKGATCKNFIKRREIKR